jgi:small subunit ribosomal protein S8
MGATDPIADVLTRIRNAYMAYHETLNVPHSRAREAVVKILKEEGYLDGYTVEDGKPFKSISIALKYVGDREPAIKKLRRLSKPGRRVYVRKSEIPSVLGGLGINILATSKGVLTGKRAQEEGVGGELLCEVY